MTLGEGWTSSLPRRRATRTFGPYLVSLVGRRMSWTASAVVQVALAMKRKLV